MNRIELEKFLNNKIVNIGNLKRKIFENSILMKSIEDNNLGIKKKVEYQVSVMKNDDGKLLHSNADKRSFAVSKILEEDAEFQKNLCIVENNRKLVNNKRRTVLELDYVGIYSSFDLTVEVKGHYSSASIKKKNKQIKKYKRNVYLI